MADEAQPVPVKVPFWKTNEGKKDIVTLLGVLMDVINYFAGVVPAKYTGVFTMAGVGCRALMNIYGNPQATQMMILFVVGALLMGSPSYANPLTTPISVSQDGEDLLGLAPIGALEFNPSTSDNYGLALSESIFFGHVVPEDNTHVVVSPYAFAGVFMAANIGKWAQSNGNAPWSIDYGLMVGLPKLDETIPEVAFSVSWNTIERGDARLMINLAFPADILPDVLVHRL